MTLPIRRASQAGELDALLHQAVQFMAVYQDKLYAESKRGLLIMLQAMDAAGKDGVIKHVMSGLNPQGVQVYSFKAPSPEAGPRLHVAQFRRAGRGHRHLQPLVL